MALKAFIDFDGTITAKDVGDEFFLRFGGPRCASFTAAYRRGEISARECFLRETAAIGSLSPSEADEFFREQTIDPGFKEFLGFCRRAGIEPAVVSDGLDFYIRRICELNDIRDVPAFSNVLTLLPVDGTGRFSPVITFPHADGECDRCACCKRNIMLGHAAENDVLIYIGEGYSDFCPARYADVVFAKDELQAHCQRENISYFVYETFYDVVKRLEGLLAKKKLRTRRRAELKRREVFMRE